MSDVCIQIVESVSFVYIYKLINLLYMWYDVCGIVLDYTMILWLH